MAKIEYNGAELELAEDWRIGEVIDAENALDLNMAEAKGGALMALMTYITIRRQDKQTPAGMIADRVMRMEVAKFGEEEEEVPLDVDEPEPRSETDEPQTIGHPRSGVSA